METPTPSPEYRERLIADCALVTLVYLAYSCDAVFAGAAGTPRTYYWLATAWMTGAMTAVLRGRPRAAPLAARLPRWSGGQARWVTALGFVAVIVAGTAALMRVMSRGYFETAYADMLPLIRAGVSRFVHDPAHTPYGTYVIPWEMHFNYLPGLWLLYCMPEWSRFLDYRVIGLACDVAVMIAWWRYSQVEARDGRDPMAFAAASLWLAAMFFLCNPHRRYGEQLHLTPWWLWLALFCMSTARRRYGWASWWMGMCCASAVAAWPLLPLWIALLWRERRGQFWKNAGIVAAPIVALFVPFLARDAGEFLFAFRRWYQVSGETFWRVESSDVYSTFGLTSPLTAAGLSRLVPALQMAGVAVMAMVGAVRMRGVDGFFRFAAAALWWFTMTAMVPKPYLYLPVLMVTSFAVLSARAEA